MNDPAVEKEIAWLGDPSAHEPTLVGGKAASLSRLAAEHRVPRGFALTAKAVELAALDLARGEVPAGLRAQIDEAYGSMGWPPVAVRSSAVDEDGEAHSFAGQHETFLNVTGTDAVAEAIVNCFASAFTERALEYRRRVGLQVDVIGLAVLVQELIPADVSAVVFSANPVDGRLDEIVINASYGLGESIVGGTTTPDTIVVGKADLRVRAKTIGEKRLMTVVAPDGTRELETPALLRNLPSVTDEQAVEMAALARGLEEAMGAPVDVECALHKGLLYLLQARPITTLAIHRGPGNGSKRS